MLSRAAWLSLILIPAAVASQQALPPGRSGAARPRAVRTPPSRSAFPTRFNYYSTSRSTLETQVHSIPATDIGRFVRLKEAFANAGCSGDAMKVQAVTEKRGSSSFNLICTWPADSPGVTVVVAHYRGAGSGQGAVENWSGALLLPYLYFAMEAQPRENTWVFVESSGKAGTAAYFRSLSRKQQRQIRAMVSLDGLGVGNVVRFYTPFPDTPYLPPDSVHLQMVLLLASLSDNRVPRPEPTNPMTWLTEDDTQPFRYHEIPSIVLHSVPVEEAALPGSVNDTAAAVDGNAYFQNYRAIAIFLVDLDSLAASLDRESDIWNSVDAQSGSR